MFFHVNGSLLNQLSTRKHPGKRAEFKLKLRKRLYKDAYLLQIQIMPDSFQGI